MASGRGPNYQELQNGSVNCFSGNSGSKRILGQEDSSILLAEDAQSRAKVEELKENLRKEASLVLRSCGWLGNVHDFMRSSKKLCALEGGSDASKFNEVKSSLIAEAKPTFISQIPESLKSSLIERLKAFSQEKKCYGPT